LNIHILNTEIQEFINSNLTTDINALLLKGTKFPNVTTAEIVSQIESKKRCLKKLPTWFNTHNIYYPNKLNIEQTSSEITAKYKSELINGNTLIDTTGGFGVDSYYFSKQFKLVTHCEINSELSTIVNHNFKEFNCNTIEVLNNDGISFLKTKNNVFDWIYIDPSRRNEKKGKVFFLEDCFPNVPEHLDLLFRYAKNIMIKTSPLLDISVGIKTLNHVKTLHIIAVNNDVKELLWILEKDCTNPISVKTINIKKNSFEKFNFNLNEIGYEVSYSQPLQFLYEPNATILKSGGFNQVSKKFNIKKLHQHSHLYTSEDKIEFPGRCFKIENVIIYSKKNIKRLGINKANITTRNFPESVTQIRKKYNIKHGGDLYLFFTTAFNNKKVVIKAIKKP